MKKRHLSIAVLASAVFLALPMTAGAQILVSGNDEKVLWDDAGKAIFMPPGKDTISFIDMGPREPKDLDERCAREQHLRPAHQRCRPSKWRDCAGRQLNDTDQGWRGLEAGAGQQSLHLRPDATPPKQIGTVEVGKQPSGLDISKKGTWHLLLTAPTTLLPSSPSRART